MPADPPPPPTLADLVELADALGRESDRPAPTLHRRDREIGRDLAHLRDRPALQLMAWLGRVREPGRRIAERVTRAQRLVTLLVIGLGLLVGWGVATAVFWYDGSHPVNVVNVLAVFVVLQLLLLVPLIVAASRRDLAWFSPARLVAAVAHLLPAGLRESISPVIGSAETHQQVYARVQKWSLLSWSQLFAVAFNVAAILRFLQLVFASDLAFAWSTTLQLDDAAAHRIVQILALPWAWAWWDAVPKPELIEATRYFRFERADYTADDPGRFGGWWPFVLMCLLVYGLLPRVVANLVASWRLRRAVAWTAVHTPGAAAVLDRLNSAYVETRAVEPESPPASPLNGDAPQADGLPARVRAVINWAGAPLDDDALRRALHADGAPVFHCGGAKSLDDDRRTIAEAAAVGGDGGVVVVTKSWEPPMLEVVDFLGDLRKALGPGAPLAAAPIALGAGSRLVPPDETHLAQWRRKLRASGDAWLTVATVEGGRP